MPAATDAALTPLAPGQIIRLQRGPLEVELAPAAGGRIAQIRVDGEDWLVGPDDNWPAAIAWGCYPMVPWAGRVRHGRFSLGGRDYALRANLDGHAIHGVGFARPWAVRSLGEASADMELALPNDAHWPFGGMARQHVVLGEDSLRLTLSAQAGAQPMPVVLGWHPWFRKPARLQFSPQAMYPRDEEGIAVLPTVDATPGPWDDCFRVAGELVLERGAHRLRMSSDCTHWVVYDGTPHAICVEPQSGPPDAFNLRPRILPPGQCLAVRFDLAWERLPADE